MSEQNRLTRIGVFYDGNFFSHVSNFYAYQHSRKARISIEGLHSFIRHRVADLEHTDHRYCQIVDSHYFRGRLTAAQARERDSEMLYRERIFDMVLISEGVVTHYLPLGPSGEKGIDVWLALEALELAILKRFDVSVLIACDGDYVPLARKLNTRGTRVMVLGWDFSFINANGAEQTTVTSQNLLSEVTYPIMMNSVIDDKSQKDSALINGLFYRPSRSKAVMQRTVEASVASGYKKGVVKAIKGGFGFIKPESGGKDVFFYYSELNNIDFNDLQEGDSVTYCLGKNEHGPCATDITVVADAKMASTRKL